jgi:hypothetical protein
MFSQTKNEYIEICIAIGCVSFSNIDKQIKHDGAWMQCYSVRTTITVPTKN